MIRAYQLLSLAFILDLEMEIENQNSECKLTVPLIPPVWLMVTFQLIINMGMSTHTSTMKLV